MKIGVPREPSPDQRLSLGPEPAKKLLKRGFSIAIEAAAGNAAHLPQSSFPKEVHFVDQETAFKSDIVFKIHRPSEQEIQWMNAGSLLICLGEPYRKDGFFEKLAQRKINSISLELIPRTSRAQSMDVLSSQANIAGYRAVLEATQHFGRYLPMMMTSAGMARPAKVVVLGVGVAGLQAIATAKRLGAQVEAFDIRPEVKEQILSLGAKFMELDLGGEEGSGAGGYAKELSEEGKRRQQQALTERLKGADIVISTANIPGRRAPILITEDAVQGMKPGSVIVDMAAANGGNCPLTKADEVTRIHGVILVGHTNYPSLMPTDSSQFFGNNLVNLLEILTQKENENIKLHLNLEDDIIAASLVTLNGEIRLSEAQKKS